MPTLREIFQNYTEKSELPCDLTAYNTLIENSTQQLLKWYKASKENGANIKEEVLQLKAQQTELITVCALSILYGTHRPNRQFQSDKPQPIDELLLEALQVAAESQSQDSASTTHS